MTDDRHPLFVIPFWISLIFGRTDFCCGSLCWRPPDFSADFAGGSYLFSEKLQGWNCLFQKTPRTEGWDKVQGSVDPKFAAGLPIPVPEILERKTLSGYHESFFLKKGSRHEVPQSVFHFATLHDTLRHFTTLSGLCSERHKASQSVIKYFSNARHCRTQIDASRHFATKVLSRRTPFGNIKLTVVDEL